MGVGCSRFSVQDDGASVRHQPDSVVVGYQSPLHRTLPKVPASIDEMPIDRENLDNTPTARDENHPELGNAEDNDDKSKLVSKKDARSGKAVVVAKRGAAKVTVGSFLGRAGIVGLGKAVEAVDTLGSCVTNLNIGSGFTSGALSKGNRIEILAFEVANTIVKGYKLKDSLSEENIKMLKEDIVCSKGVQCLVSTNMGELLSIAAADKRNELLIFSREVVRFGNHCRDPQWHHLDRYFKNLNTQLSVPRQDREKVEQEMQSLIDLVQHTAELYHELNSLDRFEAEFQRKFQEECKNNLRGNNIAILQSELRSQKKHLENLKKKSLWSKTLEEVIERLVDMVYFLHEEIQNSLEGAGIVRKEPSETLGSLGLALHYAGIVNQIDSMVSRSGSVPMNTRDNLYQSLPPTIRGSLRLRLSRFQLKDEHTMTKIKAQMEETLSWLAPLATNTTKVHHGFGWVGEWANTEATLEQQLPAETQFALLQTLHHANRRITEDYLLELIVWLHHLVILARSNAPGTMSLQHSPLLQKLLPQGGKPHGTETTEHVVTQKPSPVDSFLQKYLPQEEKPCGTETTQDTVTEKLSPEDHDMLKLVNEKKFTPTISKSQELDNKKRTSNSYRLMKSNSHSRFTLTIYDSSKVVNHVRSLPVINFETSKRKALDLIDRVDSI